ncbi:MAG: serine hydrolase domain-containing protein [Gemmatimonadaceae bacterium]
MTVYGVLLATILAAAPPQPDSLSGLIGLWEAKRHLGPEVRGLLVIDHPSGQWRATIAGRTAVARVAHDTVSFTLPDSTGAFIGHVEQSRNRIVGQWIQDRYFATPLTLVTCGRDCFSGDIVPLDEEYTFYMKVTRRPDGSLGAFLRNPERNLGRFLRVDHIEGDSANLRLLDKKGALVLPAIVRNNVITAYIENRGGSYDFHRVPDGAFTYFYPRGHPTAPYSYVPPRARDDGWAVGTLSDVGISQPKITEFVQQMANSPVDSLGSLYLHGLLIARHGKLVLEEYFYGEYGDKPHDTRSASKSVLSVMLGAAELKGAKISPETRIYSVMRPDAKNLDPRKQSLTLENLLNMASGLDCDDADDNSPGNEDNITQQDTSADWYGMILGLKMIRAPGAKAVYCSINPHLAGGVLSRITGRPLPDLMWDLIGEPLQMRNYYMSLSPLGDGYMGGGMRFRPRDFMKLGQLYLDGGTWHGKRVVSADWVKRSTVPRYPMQRQQKYGYLWWMLEFPYKGRTLQSYFMAGNGGQIVLVIPELDLVIASYAGNYNEAAGVALTTTLIPQYILPAIVAQTR